MAMARSGEKGPKSAISCFRVVAGLGESVELIPRPLAGALEDELDAFQFLHRRNTCAASSTRMFDFRRAPLATL
jgi:hypothetical protein